MQLAEERGIGLYVVPRVPHHLHRLLHPNLLTFRDIRQQDRPAARNASPAVDQYDIVGSWSPTARRLPATTATERSVSLHPFLQRLPATTAAGYVQPQGRIDEIAARAKVLREALAAAVSHLRAVQLRANS